MSAIRDMLPSDMPKVMEIELASFPSPWIEEMFLSEMSGPISRAIVIEEDDTVVGFAIFRVIIDEAHLMNIALAPEARGKGLSRKIMDFIIEECTNRGADYLFLEVRPSNLTARNLYASYGFVVVGRRKNYYTDNREDALLMEARLRW